MACRVSPREVTEFSWSVPSGRAFILTTFPERNCGEYDTRDGRSLPDRCPGTVEDLLYVVNRAGIMTCLEAKSGETVWKTRLEGAFSATPIFANSRIYLFNEDAVCTVIRPGRKFEVVAVSSLSKQQLLATPAIDGNAFLVRTGSHLYRIEADAR